MKYLEIVLTFITTLARIIFPRRKHTVAGDNPCPNPLPPPARLPLPVEERDGSNTGSPGSNPLPPLPSPDSLQHNEADYLGISGYCLMMAGGAGMIMKYLL